MPRLSAAWNPLPASPPLRIRSRGRTNKCLLLITSRTVASPMNGCVANSRVARCPPSRFPHAARLIAGPVSSNRRSFATRGPPARSRLPLSGWASSRPRLLWIASQWRTGEGVTSRPCFRKHPDARNMCSASVTRTMCRIPRARRSLPLSTAFSYVFSDRPSTIKLASSTPCSSKKSRINLGDRRRGRVAPDRAAAHQDRAAFRLPIQPRRVQAAVQGIGAQLGLGAHAVRAWT